jgi:hypothetical protein
MIEHVNAVRKEGQVFRVRWAEDGRNRSFSRRTRLEVEARYDELIQQQRAQGDGQPSLDGLPDVHSLDSAESWQAAIQEVTRKARSAMHRGDSARLMMLNRYSSLLETQCKAWLACKDMIELEEKYRDLLKWAEGIVAGKYTTDAAKPAALGDPASTLRTGAGPQPSVH